ncbi:hypothetical protein REPUB_Repub19eG0020900 [Reevesia pubescens]
MGCYNKQRDTVAPSVPSANNQYLGLPEKFEEDFLLKGITPKFVWHDPCKGWEDIAQKMDKESEDNCKEVRCIEIEDSSIKMNEKAELSSLSPENNEGKLAMEEANFKKIETGELSIHLEEQERKLATTEDVIKETEANNFSTAPEEEEGKVALTEEGDGLSTDPGENEGKLEMTITMNENVAVTGAQGHVLRSRKSPSFSDVSSSSSTRMSRSRNCRAVVTTMPSSAYFEKAEQNESTPSSTGVERTSFKDLEDFTRQKLSGLKYDNRNGNMSRNLDVEETFSATAFPPRPWKSFSGDSIRRRTSSSTDLAAGGSEMKLQSEKQIDNNLAPETTDKTDNSK